ncbi:MULTISPECIES: hypothetical protein [Haloarcula]|uniref:DUF5789 family protein n=1 Tax=Haloarcula TaxID=2237 RepID=UPI0023ED0563|nr:hypothetical protein [Halomicroarcula sp. XH51]
MEYSDTMQLFEQTFEFPADRTTVVGQLGEVELVTPAGESTTVSDVLHRTDESSYVSPNDLYASLMGNLEDGFVGRKYYDDRAGVEVGVDDVRGEDVSL